MWTTAPADAARFCKDGFVTYSSDAPSRSRDLAEAKALRAWRAAGAAVGLSRRDSFPRSDHVRCVRSEDNEQWRCFIKAGRCTTV